MPPSATYNAFVEACNEPGCPICRVEHDAALRYIGSLFYEQVNDFNMRERLRASLGFCRQHAHLTVEELQGNALGIALIYQDMIKVAIHHLDDRKGSPAPVRKCPACEQRDLTMMRTLSELSKNVQDETVTAALKKSEGLCLFHLRHTLRHMRMPEKRNLVISIQREIMGRLRAELGEFIRKNDYRFSKESFGPERDSWKRAVSMVSGAKIVKTERQ
jgi:hypothetical protein